MQPPAVGEWRMPAETEPHECTWMAWPSAGYSLGESASEAETARRTWAAVANAIVEHEPLHMLVTAEEQQNARRHLSAAVALHTAALDDAWYRDTGPTFVLGSEPGSTGIRAEPLGAVDWVFNGWGRQEWASWQHDAEASAVAIRASGAERIASPMVNEGGGLHTDGDGTFLLTETVQLDPQRNPGWTRERVEAELARTLGARKVIWLPRGLTRDAERLGTRGHVDIVATFTAPGRLLVHDQRDQAHPDHLVCRSIRAALADAVDATGKPVEVTGLPAPEGLRDDEGWVDHSYVNHYVLNGAVLACSFDDPVDDEAAEILADAYPGRQVVQVDARPLFARGGGVHCITQQQPATRPPAPGRSASTGRR